MKRLFEVTWDDEFGEKWLTAENLMTLVKTSTCIGEDIKITIDDITQRENAADDAAVADTAGTEKCKVCNFKIRNLCHRNPPCKDVGAKGGGFVRVSDDDWCGEFRPEAVVMDPVEE
ncbi:hypothetical protein LCGC14_1700270 [marine sediment metagenome]|uniref:Uncharacterized protein n=1 Tax=marine sediment metagenome TaxID=412755 RepID=A0A0F9HHY5_9ZZZZ